MPSTFPIAPPTCLNASFHYSLATLLPVTGQPAHSSQNPQFFENPTRYLSAEAELHT